jgi:hypothetical protein
MKLVHSVFLHVTSLPLMIYEGENKYQFWAKLLPVLYFYTMITTVYAGVSLPLPL